MNTLPKELTVSFLADHYGYPIYLAPFLIPALNVRHNLTTCDIEKYLLDRIVKKEAGNMLRTFIDAGWTKEIDENIYRPIIRDKNGVYQLPLPEDAATEIVNYINPRWLVQQVERIKATVERHIFSMNTLRDNTAIHNYPNSHWALHWMNPENNDQDLHFKNISLYHYPEWQINPDIPMENRIKARNTGLMIEAFYDAIMKLILAEIKPKYRKYVGFEAGNEVGARIRWHDCMDVIAKEHKVPRKMKGSTQTHERRLTSMGQPRKPQKDRWFFYRTKVYENFNYCVHNLGSVADIKIVIDDWKKANAELDDEGKVVLDERGQAKNSSIRAKFLPSMDGVNKLPTPAETKKMTKHSLETKNYGLECRGGLWGGVSLDQLDFRHGKAMMRAFKKWNS